ncbi:MAG: 50S ribosomal protein L29 [Candidatus Sericytochromatia bacterium]
MSKKLDALREKTDEELVEELKKAKEELFQLKFQLALKQLENTAKLPLLRRRIAQIHTIRTERTLAKGGKQSA